MAGSGDDKTNAEDKGRLIQKFRFDYVRTYEYTSTDTRLKLTGACTDLCTYESVNPHSKRYSIV